MKNSKSRVSGFSLVEVTIALGIAVFCLMAMMGLLSVGLTSNMAAKSQSAANFIFSAVISDLRATPVTDPLGQSTTSLQFKIPIPANPVVASPAATTLYFTSDGQYASTILGSQYDYRLTITFLPNGTAGTSPRTATFADLKITWPAAAVPPNVVGSVENFVALDRN